MNRLNRRDWLATTSSLFVAACTRRATAISSNASAASAASAASSLPIVAPPSTLELANVPGMAIATVSGDYVTVESDGVKRAGTDDKVTPDTVFEAASLSKPVFAAIVMQLVAEGAIDLTRPLVEYLPLPNPTDERAKLITATHVLSHSSGWRNWRPNKDTPLTADFAPGSRFSYSGEGYFFLQRVVEKLTGTGLLHLSRERIFRPLGMTSSSYLWRPDLDARLATGHSNRADPIESSNARAGKAFAAIAAEIGRPLDDWTTDDVERALPKMDPSMPVLPNSMKPNAAASLLTTARDYGIFMCWLMGNGPVHGGGSALERMMVQRSTINPVVGWGSGIGLEQYLGHRYVWHWGDNPGFKNFVAAEPSTRSAMIVFTNGNAGQRVYERVIRARTGVDHPAFLWI